jgi:hypothetical protein
MPTSIHARRCPASALRPAVLALAALVAAPAALAAAPVATALTPGFSFAEYTGAASVGAGDVDITGTLFYVDEQLIDGLKSWFIFYDPRGPSELTATLTFDAPIVDVITSFAGLAGSSQFESDAVGYRYARFTGLEGRDSIGFSQGGTSLRLSFHAVEPGDHIRVLTAIPEPGTYALMAGGLAMLLWLARRRRHDG